MAFCDNPKCRFKDCEGAEIRYVKMGLPRLITADTPIDLQAPICNTKTITVKSHIYCDMWTERPIKRQFCDECVSLVEIAEKKLEYLKFTAPGTYRQYLNDHGDNLLLHFVQSEWFARENSRKKSPF